jgi:hypothetical protein
VERYNVASPRLWIFTYLLAMDRNKKDGAVVDRGMGGTESKAREFDVESRLFKLVITFEACLT